MAYYQGDYYQGDYYQGDPFLGALFGKGIGWLAKKIFKRKLSPGAMTVAGERAAGGMVRAAPLVAAGVLATRSLPGIPLPGPFRMNPGAFLPGGKPFITREPAISAGAQICCPSGYHPNKQTSTARASMGAAPGTICVRNRSMNVANPRALRRGLRRVSGFGKLAMRSKKTIKAAARAMG